MAREKVENKYKAILEAAITVFAQRGFWDTSTSLISKTAGVADGTLFNYFKTKDDLISEVYLTLKRELAHELLEGLSDCETVQDKLRHTWNRYTGWGVRHPDRFKVLNQISGSYALTAEIRAQGIEPFAEISQLHNASIAQGVFRDYPVEYLGAFVESVATITVQFASLAPDKLAYYQQLGFEVLWSGISR